MVKNGLQEVLIHHTPRECNEAGWTAALLIFLLVFEDRSEVAFFFNTVGSFPDSQNFSNMIMSNNITMPTFLILKGACCQVPWTCACPVHSHVPWVDPVLLRIYLYFIKLSYVLESPGIPEGNSSQKNNKEMKKTFRTSMFSLPPVTSASTQFNTRTLSFLICWYSSESPHHLFAVTVASVPTALGSTLPMEHLKRILKFLVKTQFRGQKATVLFKISAWEGQFICSCCTACECVTASRI